MRALQVSGVVVPCGRSGRGTDANGCVLGAHAPGLHAAKLSRDYLAGDLLPGLHSGGPGASGIACAS